MFKLFSIAQFWQYTKLFGTSSSTPVTSIMIYSNADIDKLRILSDNKARIYLWIYIEWGKIYVGSTIDLSKRIKQYFNIYHLERDNSIYIYNALKDHGYFAFSLSILEFIDISNLSKKERCILILERENHYLKTLALTYNILKRLVPL